MAIATRAKMLVATTKGVAEIASQVGYESEAAVNRAFKREYGIPPARFRKQAIEPAPQMGNCSISQQEHQRERKQRQPRECGDGSAPVSPARNRTK